MSPTGGANRPTHQRRINPVAPAPAVRVRAFLARRQTQVYIESVVMTALGPAIGFLVQRSDPLFLRNGFSWLALPPVLVALRHGFGPGVTSALILIVMVFVTRKPGSAGLSGVPSELLYGVVLLTMIVGQVAAAMTRKFDKVETDYKRLRAQFDGFARSYMLLELSHERLEQRAASGLSSLRGALSSIFRARATAEGAAALSSKPALAEKMLAVMASYGRVQAGTVHVVDASGSVEPEPVAVLGKPPALIEKDTLVEAALATGEVVHSPGHNDGTATTNLIAAIPLIDSEEVRIGVVAIHALPFVALEESNLRLLFVVAGYVADAMSSVEPGMARKEARHDRWNDFVSRLERAKSDASDPRIPSALMAFWCKKAQRGTEVLELMVAKDLRATDFPMLRRDVDDNPTLLIVMPLTDRDGTLAFNARINRLSRERLGADLVTLGVSSRTWVLKDANTGTILEEISKAMEAHEGAGLASPPV